MKPSLGNHPKIFSYWLNVGQLSYIGLSLLVKSRSVCHIKVSAYWLNVGQLSDITDMIISVVHLFVGKKLLSCWWKRKRKMRFMFLIDNR